MANEHFAGAGREWRTWFALASILLLGGISWMVGVFDPALDVSPYLATAGVLLGAWVAMSGAHEWTRRRESGYMASLSVFQGIGLMVLAYSITEPIVGVLTAVMWMLIIVPTLLRLRGHAAAPADQG
jgi:peptidoglycan/LPS O-acetylase OafA/YrhL